jgi:hypothetical protein
MLSPEIRERLISADHLKMPAEVFGQHSRMWFDPKTESPACQLYQEIVLPDALKAVKPSFWSFACRPYCRKKLRRVHAHCLIACRLRKVWRKKLPAIYPVTIYALTIRGNLSHPRLRSQVLKRLAEALEWVTG